MKLYYTNAIHAAYMAEEFGVKLQLWTRDIDTGEVQYQDLENAKTILGAYGFEGINFWVHPSSFSIFEPQKDDVVYLGYGESGCPDCCNEYEVWHEAWGTDWLGKKPKVIQRDGKPFIWPQVEEQS